MKMEEEFFEVVLFLPLSSGGNISLNNVSRSVNYFVLDL
jgi:hypothetical protein